MVSLWSFAAGTLKQIVQLAAAPARLTRFWRDWECSLGNHSCFFPPLTRSLRCSVAVDSLLSSLHPSTVCVCVCGGWVLTGIFLHLLIACRYTPYLNTEQSCTHSPVYSLSLFAPFPSSFFMSLASFFLPFCLFFVSTHPFPLFFCSLSWVVMADLMW